MFNLATSSLVCVHQMHDGKHQTSVIRLSVYHLVILVTHAAQLYSTQLHHFTASHLTALVIIMLLEEGEHVTV